MLPLEPQTKLCAYILRRPCLVITGRLEELITSPIKRNTVTTRPYMGRTAFTVKQTALSVRLTSNKVLRNIQ